MLRSFPLLLLALALPAAAQTPIAIGSYCNFDGETMEATVFGFDPDDDAEAAVREVTRYTGLRPNFTIRAANVDNASAVIDAATGERLILYNQEFMRAVRMRTNSDWSQVSILAHELGHHLQGHTLQAGGSRPSIELEADQFSGFVLQRMGATLDDALRAMRAIATEEGSRTHPPRSARLAAITNGYIDSETLSGQPPSTPPPDATEPPPVARRTTPRETPRTAPRETAPPPVPTSSGIPDGGDYEGQVRYQLDAFDRTLAREGYTRTVDAHVARIDADARERFTIDLEAGTEYRIVGTCDNDCTDVDLFLYDPSGALVDSDELADDIPVVSVTPQRSGTYALEGLMFECATEFCFVGIGAWARAADGSGRPTAGRSGRATSGDRFGNGGGANTNAYTQTLTEQLDLARQHYRSEGLQQVGTDQVGTVAAGGRERFSFEASGAGTVVGVCDQDCSDVDLFLYDATGTLVDSDQLDDDVPIVSVPGAGRYSAEVVMYECSTEVCYYGAALFRQ